jgi:SAM-dependent methyltransferase
MLPEMADEAGARTLELLENAQRYNRWIFDRVRDSIGNRVLEIGCGTGTFTRFLLDRELVVGVDVMDTYVEASRQRFRDRPNVVIRLEDISRSTDALMSYRFDSAVSVNVFEHIPDDRQALRAAFALLEPAGRLTLLVPGHPRLMSPFDRAIGHYRRYTKSTLRERLESSGFVVERIRHSNPVGAAGWLLNNTLLRRRSLAGVGLYDRLVPVLSRLDRLVEVPVGLSLVAVARKP